MAPRVCFAVARKIPLVHHRNPTGGSMKIRTQRLKRASKAALISATSLASVGAIAQDAGPAQANEAETIADTIVVTGTSIKGVAPIGSSVQTVSAVDIEKTAATNLSTLVNTIPALSTNGSLAQGENLWSFYSPQIHQLGGSSSNTTLVVIDGMRSPGGGAQFNQIDPNIIPTSAIERVDVLADGASSVYGSDAVAGVVNFITRKRFKGAQINSSYGNADSYDTWDINGIWGSDWETGGVYAAASYSYGSQLWVKDRDWASEGDYRARGGSNTNSFTCDPASVRVTAVSSGTNPGGTVIFPSPTATTPVANNAPLNATCNLSLLNSFIPSQYRTNAMLRVENEFSDKLTVSGSLVYNRNQTHVDSGPGQLNSATVFGPGTTGAAAAQVNPFFTAPAGAPLATTEIINWLATREDGKYGFTESQQDVIYGNVVLDYELSDSWSLTVADSIGWNRSSLDGFKQFCGACATLALNGTTQSGGSMTASSIPGQNVVVLQLPLTTSNALDVWNPQATNRTNPLVLNNLYTSNTQNNNYNTFNQLRAVVQGDLFNLPAGPVKLAVGGEHMWQEQQFKLSGGNNTGPTVTGSGYRVFNFDRDIVSAFAEVAVPIVSPEMSIPGLYQIDLSVSGRYDDFSDVGDTTNPKYGFNWSITKGLRVRGNYAESFVAPPIAVIGDASQGYLYASGSVGGTGTLNVPVALYPQVVNIPGAVVPNTATPCTTAATTCTIGQNNTAMRRQLGGGFSQMGPQFGESYSFGIDFNPEFLPGFRSSATFFHNDFTGGVNSPSPASITASGSPLLTLCPTGCTQAQILEFANVANGATIAGSIPPTVYYLIDQSARNWLNLSIEGVDAQIGYNFDIGDTVSMRAGINGTYFTKYDQHFGTNPEFSVLNTSGFNGVFPSIQFKHRTNVGIDFGKVSTDLFWNHIGSYKNWGGSTITPLTRDANGNPNGGGDTVDATNTFDLHVSFKMKLGTTIEDLSLSLDVRNLTDEDPSFFNGNQGGFMGGAWGYDNYTANPVGRLVTLGVRTSF
jgi:iron complex outermembrane receptor protein